eukprot:TRINITY_DN21024_c0_g1_i1.p1 TRINITY_DN21024_c0_g1~~TRINITY_DN21024_c0_g1_i1.p1  ORF type:complete len:462 (+),score=61.21 TRINITY_DN21024_c0_g1_i1:359-1744(+)
MVDYSTGIISYETYTNGTVLPPILTVQQLSSGSFRELGKIPLNGVASPSSPFQFLRRTEASEGEPSMPSATVPPVVADVHYLIPANPLGPFAHTQLGKWPPDPQNAAARRADSIFDRLVAMDLEMQFRMLYLVGASSPPVSVDWVVRLHWDFNSHVGIVPLTLSYDYSTTGVSIDAENFGNLVIFDSIILLIASVWQLALLFKSVRASLRHQLYKSSPPSELRPVQEHTHTYGSCSHHTHSSVTPPLQPLDHSPANVKDQPSIFWTMLTFVSLLITITSAMAHLLLGVARRDSQSLMLVRSGLLAGSCFLTWIVSVSHLQTATKFNTLLVSLQYGVPHLGRFLIAVLPIFVAYALAGTVLFGSYVPAFANAQQSGVILFAVLNGDSILDTFQKCYNTDSAFVRIVSRLYFLSFVSVFIYACLNIALTIMQDGYYIIKASRLQGGYRPGDHILPPAYSRHTE